MPAFPPAALRSAATGLAASLCLCSVALAFEENQAQGDYVLDGDHATLLWKVDHLGFSDYVGRFNSLNATLRFEPDYPTASRLEVTVDAASLDVNNPEFAHELRGADWFNTSAHPEIRFVSTGIEQTGPETGKVTGNLTLMGVTRPVTLNVELTGQGRSLGTGRYTLGFKATGTLDRTDFGLNRMAPMIGREVTLEIHAEFTKQ